MKQTFIILCLVFIISCKKTDIIDSQNLQGNYKTGHIASVMPPIMYIQNAQITDTGIINTYLRNHNAINNMIYSPTQVISDTLLSINFSGNDSANYKYNTNQEFKAKKIQYSNTEIIIQRFDTLVFYIDPYPQLTSRCDTIGLYVSKIGSLINYIIYGNVADKIVIPRFALIYENGQLTLPLSSCIMNTEWSYTTSSGSCTYSWRDSWSIKQANIENHLISHDTIVVQEKRLPLTLQ